MRRRALLCIVGSTALAGCGGQLDAETTEPNTATLADATTTTDGSPLKLASHDLVRANEGSASELATVAGTVRNPTDESVAEATVTAMFEDADGETLDRASADTTDLSPGESWSFELVFPGTGTDARTVTDYALTVEVGD